MSAAAAVTISPDVCFQAGERPVLIAGPCQIESRDHSLFMAQHLKEIAGRYDLPLVFKSSFDKANRTDGKSARGIGLDRGLKILEEVRKQEGLPVVTDIHDESQAKPVAEVVDLLQIPAFLCRQTDLLIAAGKSGKPVNLKKGQFMHPDDMRFALEKVKLGGSVGVLLCERGTCFGYRDLVVDMRSLVLMNRIGVPVVFDATHSVQTMGGASGVSGGQREFVLPLIRAAVAVGVAGVFIEVHDNPSAAPSDGASMLPLTDFEKACSEIALLHKAKRDTNVCA